MSIHQTAHDEDGRFMPLMLRSIIDPKPALYAYAEIPFLPLFGPSQTTSRLPAVVFGMVSLILAYYIFRQFLNEKSSLLGLALLVISPWHIVLTRGSQEVMMGFCFTLVSILCFLHLQKKKNIFLFISFFLSFVLGVYSYPAVKVFLPLFLSLALILFVIQKSLSFKKALLLFGIIVAGIGVQLPIINATRFQAVSIFTNQQVQLVLNEKVGTATKSAPLDVIRLFNNKPLDYMREFAQNYTVYFSGNFLFFGNNQPVRNQTPFTGILYPIDFLFLLIGLYTGISNKKLRSPSILMIVWLLVAPLPAAATIQEIPSMIRALPMVIPLIFFITIGIVHLFSWGKKWPLLYQIGILLTVVIYLYSFSYFWFNYSVQLANYHPWYRNYADQKLATKIDTIKKKYDQIYLSNVSYTYFVLNHDIAVTSLQKSFPQRLQSPFTINSFTFINTDCYLGKNPHDLYVIKGATCKLEKTEQALYTKIATVPFKDGNPAYFLYTYTGPSLPQNR